MAVNLGQVVCQDKAIAGLQRAFATGRMPHAYLFSGQDGVGKFTTARAWAKMLLCQNRTQRAGATILEINYSKEILQRRVKRIKDEGRVKLKVNQK